MPIILRGFVWLAKFFSGLLPICIAFFARWFTKKTLLMAAYYAAYAALTVAVFSSLEATISSLSPTLPDNFHLAAGLMLPSNAYLCLSAVITAQVVRWIYDYQVKLLDISTRTWANL